MKWTISVSAIQLLKTANEMKRNLFIAAFAAAIFSLASCERIDYDIPPGMAKPDRQLTKGFNESYPDARDIEWEYKGGCWVVSFETGRGTSKVEFETWYDADGNWLMTKREYHISAVPQAIMDALSTDPEYGSARIEDNEVEYYQTPSDNFYRFDIIYNGRDMEIDVTESGVVTPARKR